MHVSAGLGVSGQRIRIGVPRDITVVRLTAEREGSPGTRCDDGAGRKAPGMGSAPMADCALTAPVRLR
jgi:hypothetical protein